MLLVLLLVLRWLLKGLPTLHQVVKRRSIQPDSSGGSGVPVIGFLLGLRPLKRGAWRLLRLRFGSGRRLLLMRRSTREASGAGSS